MLIEQGCEKKYAITNKSVECEQDKNASNLDSDEGGLGIQK